MRTTTNKKTTKLDRDLFTALPFAPWMYTVCNRKLTASARYSNYDNGQLAELATEATQEAIAYAWEKWSAFRAKHNLDNWRLMARRAVCHALYDCDMAPLAPSPTTGDIQDDALTTSAARRLNSLDQWIDDELVLLRFGLRTRDRLRRLREGSTIREIAKEDGQDHRTVHRQLVRAIKDESERRTPLGEALREALQDIQYQQTA